MPPKDGRSAAAVFMRRAKASLRAHVGEPNATQAALIDRAAMLMFHVARMDAAAIEAGGFSDHARREYLAWSNSLSRTLRVLGEAVEPSADPASAPDPAPAPAPAPSGRRGRGAPSEPYTGPSLAEIMARHHT